MGQSRCHKIVEHQRSNALQQVNLKTDVAQPLQQAGCQNLADKALTAVIQVAHYQQEGHWQPPNHRNAPWKETGIGTVRQDYHREQCQSNQLGIGSVLTLAEDSPLLDRLACAGQRHTNDEVDETHRGEDIQGGAVIIVLADTGKKNDVNENQGSKDDEFAAHGQRHKPSGQQRVTQVAEQQGAQEPRELVVGVINRIDWSNIGPLRIWYKNKKYPGLSITRSFGDFESDDLGVISEPDLREYDIDEEKIKIIIFGTVGIWQFLTNDKIMDIVLPYYEQNDVNGATKKISETAIKLWSVKNPKGIADSTVFVLFFK